MLLSMISAKLLKTGWFNNGEGLPNFPMQPSAALENLVGGIAGLRPAP
jgi:hypothetical protein